MLGRALSRISKSWSWKTESFRLTTRKLVAKTTRVTGVFGGPVARILDEARIVGNMEQTVSMLAESTRLDYKTVQGALERLIKLGLVKKTRKIGNAQAYRLNVENELHSLLEWAEEFQHGKRRRR